MVDVSVNFCNKIKLITSQGKMVQCQKLMSGCTWVEVDLFKMVEVVLSSEIRRKCLCASDLWLTQGTIFITAVCGFLRCNR